MTTEESRGFPQDYVCYGRPPFVGLGNGECYEPPEVEIRVDGGGWIAKFCEQHLAEWEEYFTRRGLRRVGR